MGLLQTVKARIAFLRNRVPSTRELVPALLAFLGLAVMAGTANAFTAPTATDLGFDIYDLVVEQGVKGPMGFVGGVAAFIFGVSQMFRSAMVAFPSLIAAVCLIKADSILTSVGMTF